MRWLFSDSYTDGRSEAPESRASVDQHSRSVWSSSQSYRTGGVTEFSGVEVTRSDLEDKMSASTSAAAAAGRHTSNWSSSSTSGCSERFLNELNPCQPWFSVTDVSGRKINVPECFAPATCTAFFFKLVGLLSALFTLTYGFIKAKDIFYLAYFSTWGVIFASLYYLLSIFNTIFAASVTQPPEAVSGRIRLTWILFELAANWGILASIFYWVMIFDSNTTFSFNNLAANGIVALLVWIDGFLVNCIPVRWMHWYGFVLPIESLWVLWSYLQVLLELGNGTAGSDASSANDDATYGAFAWKNDWVYALWISLLGLFGLGPLVYLVMWLVSGFALPCCCKAGRIRYLESYEDEGDARHTESDMEEGSIFGKWG